MRLATCLIPFLLTTASLLPVDCQEIDRAHASLGHTIATPANSWQGELREAKATPTSPKELAIRADRDAYVDKVHGVGIPLEELQAKNLAYKFPNLPLPLGSSEIPAAFPDELVVVGDFNSFDAVLSKTHQTIYDEIHISVDRVLFPEDSSLAGSMIDILTPGGTVLINGKTISYRTAPQEHGLAPGFKYVLFLEHVIKGDFYLLTDSVSLDNGVAHPNSQIAAQAASQGKWVFTGLAEPDLFARISADIKKQHQQ